MLTLIRRTAAVATLVLTCGTASAAVKVNGGGATFPNPVYQRWVSEYDKVNPNARIDYASVGSGGGIKGLIAKTYDFAGSDAPLSDSERKAAGSPVVHIPTVAGSVVAAYNLPGFKGQLNLDGPVLADIYLGNVTKWNDAKIAALNQGAQLPAVDITPVYRTDGSGTTFVFTSYLSTQSNDYSENIGKGKSVEWPTGIGGKGNEGVTAVLQDTPGAIGYVELNYAVGNKIPFAAMKNKAGKFVVAGADTVRAAGGAASKGMQLGKLETDIWNQDGDAAYPISAYTYVIVYKDLGYLGEAKAQAVVDYLTWATTQGQSMAAAMSYAPLDPAVQKLVQQELSALTINGKPARPTAAAAAR